MVTEAVNKPGNPESDTEVTVPAALEEPTPVKLMRTEETLFVRVTWLPADNAENTSEP